MNIKDTIQNYMIAKGNYSESDEILIDELIFNTILIKKAKEDILKRGIILNNNDPDAAFDKVNKSINAYNALLKNLTSLFVRLGISPKERLTFKIEMAEKLDEFDEAFA